MKYLKLGIAMMVTAFLLGCATLTGTPTEKYITAATTATKVVDQVVLAANKATIAGVLKGQDAENTLAAVKLARDGLNVSKTMDPEAGLNKVQLTLAVLTATQIYLDALVAKQGGAKP